VIDDEISKMTAKLQAEKKNDFITYKEEIKFLLASEIVSRYYFQKGRIEWAMELDNDIKTAKEYLRNNAKYKEILSSSFQIPRKEKYTKTEGLDKILIEIDESVE
jgi:carboxyl-terminal processing protease